MKLRNKDLSAKDPKLYNYLNCNINTEQNQAKAGLNKRVSSAQEISISNKFHQLPKVDMIPTNQPKPKNVISPFRI